MHRYGLVGYRLGHSFSKKYFADKFSREGLHEYVYGNFELDKIDQFPTLIQNNPDILGLNITIPYKEAILQFLHEQSETVQLCKACNCIKITAGKLRGYNTDIFGFTKSLTPELLPRHNKALILGTGGASKAVRFSLDKMGIGYRLVSRRPVDEYAIRYEDITAALMAEHLLIINTTPLGTFPGTETFPQIPYNSLSPGHHLYDLAYNPAKTKFLEMGEERGASVQNGLRMLEYQAEESWRIWNDPL